ncbi:MAG: anti-sigma factor domain-containing protein [Candidatus Binataceae bacterium]
MDHQEIKDLLALAALDRLEPEEARALEEHLRAGCDECEAELREFREAAAAIPLGLDPAGTEERIWQRLDARLHSAGAASAGPSIMGADSSQPPAARSVGWWRAATGVMAAAAIAIAIYAGLLGSQLRRTATDGQQRITSLDTQVGNLRAELDSARGQVSTLQHVLADRTRLEQVLMAPDLRLTRLEPLPAAPNARAIVAVSSVNRSAMVQAFGLPPTPPGKTYELWWITKESGPVAAGLFQVENGRNVVAPATPPPAGERVLLSAVTLEPAGGVSKPTGAMYLKGAVAYE